MERTRIVKPSELMKSVAATYLFQPHRAARDFRGIRNEYSDKLFLEEHSVIPYHAASYASYRFDYLVRNKRLSRSTNIYKFYMLSALGHKNTSGIDIFAAKPKYLNQACDGIISVARDESNMIHFCQESSKIVESLLVARLGSAVDDAPRERVRDALRSETFAADFHKNLGS